MKKLIYLLVVSLLFVSCTTPRLIDVPERDYSSEISTYDMKLISNRDDFFKVYRINESDYAILPYNSSGSYVTVDHLSRSLIFSNDEAKDFAANLQEFIDKCEKSKGELFFSEVKVIESSTKLSSVVESEDTTSVQTQTSSKVVFVIQGYLNEDSFVKSVKIVGYSKFNYEPYSLELNDLKNLIKVLEK